MEQWSSGAGVGEGSLSEGSYQVQTSVDLFLSGCWRWMNGKFSSRSESEIRIILNNDIQSVADH